MLEGLSKPCPQCPPRRTGRGAEVPVELETEQDNYSGCGVDICRCPVCGRRFQVSYRVDEIVEIPE